ncbi:hypothetical protein HDV06_002577 [Boothiomyces sp. JEL0866]|nr:hypothetical protein HDV06_002577 [Boothiomyces sp. JEL0866]
MKSWFKIFQKSSVRDSAVGSLSQCKYCSPNPIMTKLRELEQRIMQHQLDLTRQHRQDTNSEIKKIHCLINDLFVENVRLKEVVAYLIEKAINAIGNTSYFSKIKYNKVKDAGVTFKHIAGGKNAADNEIIAQMIQLTQTIKPPYTIVLISSDSDFSHALGKLKALGYTVVLLHLGNISHTLRHSCTNIVKWNDVLRQPLTIKFKTGVYHTAPISFDFKEAKSYSDIRYLPILRAVQGGRTPTLEHFKLYGFESIASYQSTALRKGIIELATNSLTDKGQRILGLFNYVKNQNVSFQADYYECTEEIMHPLLTAIFHVHRSKNMPIVIDYQRLKSVFEQVSPGYPNSQRLEVLMQKAVQRKLVSINWNESLMRLTVAEISHFKAYSANTTSKLNPLVTVQPKIRRKTFY